MIRNVLVAVLAVQLVACEMGDNVPWTISWVDGRVSIDEDRPESFVPVALVGIDDSGEINFELRGGFTDADGYFEIPFIEAVEASTHLAVVAGAATDPNKLYKSLLFKTDELQVDPVSTGILEAMTLITRTPGGLSLSSYSVDEVAGLDMAARGLSFSDLEHPDMMLQEILDGIGGVIVELHRGTIYVTPPLTVEEPADEAVTVNTFPYPLDHGNGSMYAIDRDGRVVDGDYGAQVDAFDTGFRIRVAGSILPLLPGALEDENELVLGPATLIDLQATRKIHLADSDGILRYTEILDNTGMDDAMIDVQINQQLYVSSGAQILNTSTGDTQFSSDDRWIYLDDANLEGDGPITAFWFGDNVSEAIFDPNTSTLSYGWQVMVPAGGRATIVHFGFMAADQASAESMLVENLPPASGEYLLGMTQGDVDVNQSFSPGGIVIGETGAVAPWSEVTATNLESDRSMTGQAESDGSFRLVVGGVSGDRFEIMASDGTSVTITAE